jgi:hypothetical protein
MQIEEVSRVSLAPGAADMREVRSGISAIGAHLPPQSAVRLVIADVRAGQAIEH